MYIQVSIREQTDYDDDKSTEDILCVFARLNGIDPPQTGNIKNLRLWLNRISYIKEFKSSKNRNIMLTSRVLKYVEMANSIPKFREMFELVISDAAETCGDRMALSIVKLDVLYQLANVKDAKEKILVHGVWTLSLLEDLARQKVEYLRMNRYMVDEIEVYLAYPIKLKERLNIPIFLSDMLHYGLTCITETDLVFAEERLSPPLPTKNYEKNFYRTTTNFRRLERRQALKALHSPRRARA